MMALTGNQLGESEILSKLSARFLPIISLTIKAYPVLLIEDNLDDKCSELCQKAIDNVKRLYPLSTGQFSIKRAVTVLHNLLDDYIANALYQIARSGNRKAEESLFTLIRKKLEIYIKNKFWRN
jgi:hypothetical protein